MASLLFPLLPSPTFFPRHPLRCRLLATTASSVPRHRPSAASSSACPDNFVAWFRHAWPYVRAHRGSTFVIVIAGEVVDDGPCLDGILQDVALLHGLGIRFLIVPATNVAIDRALEEKGRRGRFVGPYRVTDAEALDAAMEAAGRVKQMVEARLSPGPSMLNLRRHGDCGRWHEVGVPVASGNFLAAKRRGVVEGIDFGATGEVKKIDVSRIREILDRDCIVIVNNLGYSSSGHVLNCNSYEVATACALAIEADKLICIIDGQILDENGHLIRFMNLRDADMRIRKRSGKCGTAANYIMAVGDDVTHLDNHHADEVTHLPWKTENLIDRDSTMFQNGVGFANGNGFWNNTLGFPVGGNQRLGRYGCYTSELAASVFVCKGGVQRVHLVDGTLGGALLLELFTRDGVGTMVASDAYEGTRLAREMDLPCIKQLIQPLEKCGVPVPRTTEELQAVLDFFIVIERDGSVIACAALFPYLEEQCGEIAFFAVSPDLCGGGHGRKLLDYIEKMATSMGLWRLFLLTTCAADWFVRRGFVECKTESIPRARRVRIDFSRGFKYYAKYLRPDVGGLNVDKPASKSF